MAGVATALAGAVLLGACSSGPTAGSAHVESSDRPASSEYMPAAPTSESAWVTEVDRIYDHAAAGRSAETWLRQRMARRRPGERLAVIMGIDDVMVATHFQGVHTLVPRSVQFAETAHALGYAVFYVTGRSSASGLGDVEAFLQQSGVPDNAVYGRPVGAPDVETGKAQVRASIERQGYTLAMEVAASEASFDGRAKAEKEVRLPDFSVRG